MKDKIDKVNAKLAAVSAHLRARGNTRHNPRAMKAKTVKTPEVKFSKLEWALMAREGWAVFNEGAARQEIERDDEEGKFATDDDAIAHVMRRALAGSQVHVKALVAHCAGWAGQNAALLEGPPLDGHRAPSKEQPMNLTTPKKRTITLTARPPISVNEECPSCNPKSDAERPDPQVMISNEQWRENGSEYGDKPWARLITTLRVNGVAFHLEAIAVEEDAKCTLVACDPAFESDLNALADLAEPSGQWDTMPIRRNGIEREYVVFATPHC